MTYDPLRRATPVTHEAIFGPMRLPLRFQTNSPDLLVLAEEAFARFGPPPAEPIEPELLIRLFIHEVDDLAGTGQVYPNPVHRAQDGLVFIAAGRDSVMTLDLNAGWAFGFISPTCAADRDFTRATFIEGPFYCFTERRGVIGLHAGCIVHAGRSLVLIGPSGAGKSTLTYACARRGCQVLSDEAVFSRADDVAEEGYLLRDARNAAPDPRLRLWAGPLSLQLLPDAVRFFPELADLPAQLQRNGERKIDVNLSQLLPAATVVQAPAGPMAFVERNDQPDTHFELMPAEEAFDQIMATHYLDEPPYMTRFAANLRCLIDLGTYRPQMGWDLDRAVDVVKEFLERGA
jgi:hypothetical protein